MKEINFLVQGSANHPYNVTFRINADNLTALCDCPAGQNRMYCKHRFRIMDGLTDGVISGNFDEIEIIKQWLVGSDVEKAIDELKELEIEMGILKKKISDHKKKLARKLID